MNTVITVIISLIVLGFILSRQLREQPIKEDRGFQLPILLCVFGLLEIATSFEAETKGLTFLSVILLLVGLFSGAIFGWIRAKNTHLWYDKGQLMRQGNVITIVLWVVGIGLHLGLESFSGHINPASASITNTSILLYLGISLAVQRYITLQRARLIKVEHHDKDSL
jgi:4-hydroxybenzoate polyprenyltransferase